MPIVQIPTKQITDWASFHDIFARALGFPDYYGRNMDAWIDCLTHAGEELGMVSPELVADEGDVLTLQLEDVPDFAERCPEQYDSLIECAAFVNWRRIETGARPLLALSFRK